MGQHRRIIVTLVPSPKLVPREHYLYIGSSRSKCGSISESQLHWYHRHNLYQEKALPVHRQQQQRVRKHRRVLEQQLSMPIRVVIDVLVHVANAERQLVEDDRFEESILEANMAVDRSLVAAGLLEGLKVAEVSGHCVVQYGCERIC